MFQTGDKNFNKQNESTNFRKIRSAIKANGFTNGMFSILLKKSPTIDHNHYMAPGREFHTAMNKSKKLQNCLVYLSDQPINFILQRLFKSLTLCQKLKFFCMFLANRNKMAIEGVEYKKPSKLTEKDLRLFICLQRLASASNNAPNLTEQCNVVGVVRMSN